MLGATGLQLGKLDINMGNRTEARENWTAAAKEN
jgi:hypothetical protein